MNDGTPSAKRIGASALERILEATRKLALPIDLRSMLGEVVDAAREVLDSERGKVFLFEAATNELVAAVRPGSASCGSR